MHALYAVLNTIACMGVSYLLGNVTAGLYYAYAQGRHPQQSDGRRTFMLIAHKVAVLSALTAGMMTVVGTDAVPACVLSVFSAHVVHRLDDLFAYLCSFARAVADLATRLWNFGLEGLFAVAYSLGRRFRLVEERDQATLVRLNRELDVLIPNRRAA